MTKLKFKGTEARNKHPNCVATLQNQLKVAGYEVSNTDIALAWEAMTDEGCKGWALLYDEPSRNVEKILSQLKPV